VPPKKARAPLPFIAWDANDHTRLWRSQNLKVLCRKLTKHGVSGLLECSH
ncbi:hypothetical protein PAXRUDRAFT_147110, partial [Paxillus rubicundulus Ve08.2h10]